MKDNLRCSLLEIRKVNEHYGVFAKSIILADTVIEEAQVILVHRDQVNDDINEYIFTWDETFDALALGYGSIYNNSQTPNAKYYRDSNNQLLIIKAIKNIAEGEEVLINYGNDRMQRSYHAHLPLAQNVSEEKLNSEPTPLTAEPAVTEETITTPETQVEETIPQQQPLEQQAEFEPQPQPQKVPEKKTAKKSPPAKESFFMSVIVQAIIYIFLIVVAAYILFFI